MSKKTAPPPFADDDDDILEMPPPSASKGVMIREPSQAGSLTRDASDPKKRGEPEGSKLADPHPKKQKTGKETGTTPQATTVHHMFAKMGHQNASEADVHSWCNASLEDTVDATTHRLAEAFLRQASHAKEIKNLSRDNKILKFKLTQADNDQKKMAESHKLAMKQEIEQLRKELREAKNKVSNLEKARDEEAAQAKAAQEKLDSDRAALDLAQKDLELEFKAQGQKIFMKKFIKKVPDFDWIVFGAAVAGYAEDLKAELVEEARKRKEELMARQAEEASKHAQDGGAERTPNQDAEAQNTNAEA